MIKYINNKKIEITYDKLDYYIMFLENDLSLKEFLKFINNTI